MGCKYGETALMHAARSGHVAAIDCLIERGADIEAKDKVSWAMEAVAEVRCQRLKDRLLFDGCACRSSNPL